MNSFKPLYFLFLLPLISINSLALSQKKSALVNETRSISIDKHIYGEWLQTNGSEKFELGISSHHILYQGNRYKLLKVTKEKKINSWELQAIEVPNQKMLLYFNYDDKTQQLFLGKDRKKLKALSKNPIASKNYSLYQNFKTENINIKKSTFQLEGIILKEADNSLLPQYIGISGKNVLTKYPQYNQLISVDDQGYFKSTIQVYGPGYFHFTIRDQTYRFFASQDKRIFLWINQKGELKFQKDLAALNKNSQLLSGNITVEKKRIDSVFEKNFSISLSNSSYKNFIQNELNKILSHRNNLTKKYHIDSFSSELTQLEIKKYVWNTILDFENKKYETQVYQLKQEGKNIDEIETLISDDDLTTLCSEEIKLNPFYLLLDFDQLFRQCEGQLDIPKNSIYSEVQLAKILTKTSAQLLGKQELEWIQSIDSKPIKTFVEDYIAVEKALQKSQSKDLKKWHPIIEKIKEKHQNQKVILHFYKPYKNISPEEFYDTSQYFTLLLEEGNIVYHINQTVLKDTSDHPKWPGEFIYPNQSEIYEIGFQFQFLNEEGYFIIDKKGNVGRKPLELEDL